MSFLSVHRGGISFPACITGHMTRGSASRGSLPPGGLPPGGGLHPRGSASRRGVCIPGGLPSLGLDRPPLPEKHGILRDTVNKRTVCILLECILVYNNFNNNDEAKQK